MADEETKDAKEVTPAPTLDQVNELTQQKLAHEHDDSGTEDTNDAAADDNAAPDDSDTKPDEVPDTAPPAPPRNEPETPAAQPAPELKPDAKKIAVKGYDGKTHYFANMDEVPDDFEPASYKEWGRAVRDFTNKEIDDARAARKADREAKQQEQDQRAQAMQDGWDKDITTLTDSGVLPKDGRERKGVVNEVYQYMSDRMGEGTLIDSFSEAYKAMQYNKMKEAEAAEQQKLNDVKKKRGGLVQAGGTAPAAKPTVREGVPPGVSLDAVHNKVLASL